MFGIYFGKYLQDIGVISTEIYEKLIEKCRNERIELGVIAVNEGMMIDAQADEVNFLQTMQDMKFGDVAVSMNYLSREQLDALLRKQGNGYLRFVQLLMDEKILTLDEIQEHLNNFRKREKLTIAEIEAIKQENVGGIIRAYLKNVEASEEAKEYLSLVGRNMVRFVDNQVRFESCSVSDIYTGKFLALQQLSGDINFLVGLGDTGIRMIAEEYCEEDFYEIDEECLDAVCEFMNVTNGEYASKMSELGKDVNLGVPQMFDDYTTIQAENILLLPCYLFGERVDLILCESGKWDIG